MLRRTLLTTAVLGLGLAIGGAAQAQDKLKACWVYVGPIGDGGWTFQHEMCIRDRLRPVRCREAICKSSSLAANSANRPMSS